jgi:hypothetical protein
MFSSIRSLRRFKSRFPFQNVLNQKVSSKGNYLPTMSLSSREMSGGHDHHDTTFEPPFHRLPLQNKPVSTIIVSLERNIVTLETKNRHILTFFFLLTLPFFGLYLFP